MKEIVIKIVAAILVVVLLIVEWLGITITVWELVIKLVVLVLLVVIIVVEVRPKKLCHAFIYQAKETKAIIYCDNDEGAETRDFIRVGDGMVRCDLVVSCYLVK